MASNMYFVKRDVGLFRKGNWTIVLNSRTTGIYPERAGALAAAIAEAERTSFLGRATEVWVNDGHGFNFEKAFKAGKAPDAEGKPGEMDLTGEEDIVFTVDDPTTDTPSY
ncbi:MAG: hypothetical protein M3T55_09635 [Pseudomonadota bacterium]|nr:hypothetical protein [Pseudomonadota bacterium]